MGKKILIGCYEIPGYGGAGTASYELFEIMKDDGLDVCYLNIIDEEDADYFRYVYGENFGNPKCLDHVYNCILNRPLFYPHPKHPELVDLVNDLSPDILVGIGYIAALLMKQAAPVKRLMFLTSGCNQAQNYIVRKQAKDLVALNEFIHRTKGRPILSHAREKEAVEISDLIITHSDITMFLYQCFFPSQVGKVYSDVIWFAEWIYKGALDYSKLKKTFSERDIDILFIASMWSRPVKNYKLVKKIVSRCKSLKIHIVGEVEEKFDNAKYHGLITRREDLFSLLGRAKSVVCPSLFDAAPGTLFEASAMGCNIIASKNCGNWRNCNEQLLVDPFNLNNFLEKIHLSLSKKYEDNIDYFLKTYSYKKLVDTILIF